MGDGFYIDAAFEADWPMHSRRFRDLLDNGQNILAHCRGGLGRAGMISARLLVESGVEPDEAMTRVRAAPPGAIETPRQEAWARTGRTGPAIRRR
jgi:ADP-ribosyl-[dinitrogen reductase] hydrolase